MSDHGDVFTLECPKCGKKLKVSAALSGKRGKCPACQMVLTIPASKSVSVEVEPIQTNPGELMDDTIERSNHSQRSTSVVDFQACLNNLNKTVILSTRPEAEALLVKLKQAYPEISSVYQNVLKEVAPSSFSSSAFYYFTLGLVPSSLAGAIAGVLAAAVVAVLFGLVTLIMAPILYVGSFIFGDGLAGFLGTVVAVPMTLIGGPVVLIWACLPGIVAGMVSGVFGEIGNNRSSIVAVAFAFLSGIPSLFLSLLSVRLVLRWWVGTSPVDDNVFNYFLLAAIGGISAAVTAYNLNTPDLARKTCNRCQAVSTSHVEQLSVEGLATLQSIRAVPSKNNHVLDKIFSAGIKSCAEITFEKCPKCDNGWLEVIIQPHIRYQEPGGKKKWLNEKWMILSNSLSPDDTTRLSSRFQLISERGTRTEKPQSKVDE